MSSILFQRILPKWYWYNPLRFYPCSDCDSSSGFGELWTTPPSAYQAPSLSVSPTWLTPTFVLGFYSWPGFAGGDPAECTSSNALGGSALQSYRGAYDIPPWYGRSSDDIDSACYHRRREVEASFWMLEVSRRWRPPLRSSLGGRPRGYMLWTWAFSYRWAEQGVCSVGGRFYVKQHLPSPSSSP